MAGFVAILETSGNAVEERLVRSLLDLPPFDAGRTAVWTAGGVGLGAAPLHSRHPAASPSLTRCGLVIVMDGRLDDRATLARRLEADVQRRLDASSDVELALTAYERWGSDCARHLLGDFSFCVWDSHRRQLFCVRDHLGVKPLYYARLGGTLFVSNVLRSLRRHPGVSDRLDDRAICDVLLAGAVMDESRTSFADVKRVPPAHTLTCTADSAAARIDRFWSLQPGGELRLRDPHEYVARYASVLRAVVADRVGDGPFGVSMSGGLDSSSVAATAADVLGPDLTATGMRAYTLVYESADDREGRYASLVSQRLGIEIEHHPTDDYAWFARWDAGLLPPEPTTEPMTAITADVLERASRHGAVVLTGDGGDPSLLPSPLASLLGRTSVGGLAKDLWQSAWTTRTLPPIGVRSMVRSWFSTRNDVPVWLSPSFVRECDPRHRLEEIGRLRAPASGPRGLAASAVIDPWWTSMFETYDPGATRRPVELRYPLFDVRLIELAMTLPTHPWCVNKEIVRRAMCGRLPEEVRLRPKRPLAVDLHRLHGRWDAAGITRTVEAMPALARYVDAQAFRSTCQSERALTGEEPGMWALVSLATWLQCSAASAAR